MYIHFAFGSDGKAGRFEDQASKVISYILNERRLKASYCTEFLPQLPKPGSHKIKATDLIPFGDNDGGQGASTPIMRPDDIDSLPIDQEISYLPTPVAMICFIKISLKKLYKSPHCHEYGKLGLVFDEDFLRRHGMKRVQYYREDFLERDPVICEWNSQQKTGTKREIELSNRILRFRKPAYYFPAFAQQTMLKIAKGVHMPLLGKCYKYSRYEIGYDFSAENEYRIVMDSDNYVNFEEDDLRIIIAPNPVVLNAIENYIDSYWVHRPDILLFRGN